MCIQKKIVNKRMAVAENFLLASTIKVRRFSAVGPSLYNYQKNNHVQPDSFSPFPCYSVLPRTSTLASPHHLSTPPAVCRLRPPTPTPFPRPHHPPNVHRQSSPDLQRFILRYLAVHDVASVEQRNPRSLRFHQLLSRLLSFSK